MIRGEIWWVDLGIPFGSEPGYKRPVVVIQEDSFNKSRIQTVIVASVTSNLSLADAPGNVYLEKEESKLPKDSVINISQIVTLDKQRLIEKAAILPSTLMIEVDYGLRIILNMQ
ncbi:type II toxin-antitoxin system PemK/MazF family toxin [Oceanispirochaeta crateris]|uniref:mRNA interferase n=1 Tax=Oceanispirochaeta crateris TaxID=2518645 RepID=A0A5C1QM60_9SPIO|nr:type II toxin-antitoxin system PemK/MazF family toxin [Oceanispirochaeta crateris]QEN09153.1 type II toxin-antitoxin system PemK/MazF family toxin [Oceanispirochaeta crateris]